MPCYFYWLYFALSYKKLTKFLQFNGDFVFLYIYNLFYKIINMEKGK